VRLTRPGSLVAAPGTKITSFDPVLFTVRTACPTPPLQAWPMLFDPPIELASRRPGGHLHRDRRIDFPAVCFAVLARIEIPHVQLEHADDCGGSELPHSAAAMRLLHHGPGTGCSCRQTKEPDVIPKNTGGVERG
jgi:hypothetical protein